ncbi:MAG: class I SAM-dependent methyltransferase [Clostridiales bacterium]|nr:class I SAM-dependent methyltransferase [Clostridiales bacterium]
MYTALGEIYDLFKEDDDEKRAAYLSGFLPKGEGVDIGCGTGGLTHALYKRGLGVYGVDASEVMLRRAVEKAGASVRFVLGDAESFPYAHTLDFAVASNDVFNYVGSPLAAFRHVYGALKKGGVFVFDISSAYKLCKVLAGNTFSETKEGITYIWQNFREGNKLFIDFTVFSPQGETYIKTSETQVQYVRTQAYFTKALQKTGFARVETYAYYTKANVTKKTERILFVAQKSE